MEDEDFRAGDEWEDLGGPYRGICYADDLVPTELALSLEKHLDELAALPDKDFHPGSEGMVCFPPFGCPLRFRCKISFTLRCILMSKA